MPSTVTLLVDDKQALLLADLEANGKIHLVFVYRGNEENCILFLLEQEKILEQLKEDEKMKNEEMQENKEEQRRTIQRYGELLVHFCILLPLC